MYTRVSHIARSLYYHNNSLHVPQQSVPIFIPSLNGKAEAKSNVLDTIRGVTPFSQRESDQSRHSLAARNSMYMWSPDMYICSHIDERVIAKSTRIKLHDNIITATCDTKILDTRRRVPSGRCVPIL